MKIYQEKQIYIQSFLISELVGEADANEFLKEKKTIHGKIASLVKNDDVQ